MREPKTRCCRVTLHTSGHNKGIHFSLVLLLLTTTGLIVWLQAAHVYSRCVSSVLRTSISSPSARQSSSQLRVFVAQTPAYQHDSRPQDRYGFATLGEILDVDNQLWTSYYEHQDSWWINQMNISPLQVSNAEDADIVFVAAHFDSRRPNISEEVQDFMAAALDTFPDLGQKPHVIALNNPFHVYTYYVSTIQTMPQSELFTFVTIEAHSTNQYSSANWITAPYMAHVHWHQGLPAQGFNATEVKEAKKRLALMSAGRFLDHMTSKGAMRDSCEAHAEHCMFVQWQGENESASTVFEGMKTSWFTLMPRGDFVTRNSLYDAIMASSIPVVDVSDITNYMPYKDMIDWDHGMVHLPESSVDAASEFRHADETLQQSHQQAAPHGQLKFEQVSLTDQFDFVDWLNRTWNEDDVLTRQKFLHAHKHVMQYSVNPDHHLVRFDTMFDRHPADDAFTFTWKAILRNLCERSALPAHRCTPVVYI